MRILVSMPVPRNHTLPRALDWTADVFAEFLDRGWSVRDEWTLTLGSSRWRSGTLAFTCERSPDPSLASLDSARVPVPNADADATPASPEPSPMPCACGRACGVVSAVMRCGRGWRAEQ
jgi:hypothetical protein